ncbi:MAG: hypothetical protein FWG47_02305 [Propionibacteriaceae bacterium]|nr:hypothetical protein [Propionibacteriaceae bacterium]
MFYWVCEPELSCADQRRLGLDLGFLVQADADEWLGVNFSELLELGVRSVSLLKDQEVVFSSMSLDE